MTYRLGGFCESGYIVVLVILAFWLLISAHSVHLAGGSLHTFFNLLELGPASALADSYGVGVDDG